MMSRAGILPKTYEKSVGNAQLNNIMNNATGSPGDSVSLSVLSADFFSPNSFTCRLRGNGMYIFVQSVLHLRLNPSNRNMFKQ